MKYFVLLNVEDQSGKTVTGVDNAYIATTGHLYFYNANDQVLACFTPGWIAYWVEA